MPLPIETNVSDDAVRRNLDAISKLLGPLVKLVRFGTGTPESVVTAPVGTLFLRADGGATTTLYVKTSGTGNTGWTAK